jgi:RHS repeat-associated protein
MSNQAPHCETSQSAVRVGALQRGATIDFGYDTWWRWDLGWSAVTQYADTDTDWTVEGFNRFFVPFGHAALAEADVTTTPANAAYNYLAQDHLGTGRFVYDQAKAETAAVEHLPYGDRYAATGDAPYHEFTGKPWDDDAGLFYFPYRYYAPTIGRWISPDPLGLVDGPNVYAYGVLSPIACFDALGLAVKKEDPCSSKSPNHCQDCCLQKAREGYERCKKKYTWNFLKRGLCNAGYDKCNQLCITMCNEDPKRTGKDAARESDACNSGNPAPPPKPKETCN